MKTNILIAATLLAAHLTTPFMIGQQPVREIPDSIKEAMLREADDFIDALPDGLQDRQADAIRHALRGQTGELKKLRKSRDTTPVYPQNVEVKDIAAEGLNMRLYRPKETTGKLPLLIYLHGGGWTLGSLNSCGKFCSSLASKGNVAVLAVDYPLAPEKPFPSSLDASLKGIRYAFTHAEELGTTPGSISVGGDSAGGNLAIVSAMSLHKDSPELVLKSMVLFYPVVKGYKDGTKSWKKYSKGYGLDARLMDTFVEAYILDWKGVNDPYVSPGDASDAMLESLPPTLIVNAGRDILNDQGREFHERLNKLGKESERVEFPGAVHLFVSYDGQPSAFSTAVDLVDDYLTVGTGD